MSADPLRRVDRRAAAADRLLREARIDDQAEKEALAGLLAAAAAPARATELSGEQAALAAFREARHASATRHVSAAGELPEPGHAPVPGHAPGPAPVTPPDEPTGVTAGTAVPAARTEETNLTGRAVASGSARDGSRDDGAAHIPLPRPGRFRTRPPVGTGPRFRLVRAFSFGLAAVSAGGLAALAVAGGTGELPGVPGGEDTARGAQRTATVSDAPQPLFDTGPGTGTSGITGRGHGVAPEAGPVPDGDHSRSQDKDRQRLDGDGTHRSPSSSPWADRGQDETAGESSLRELCRKYLRHASMNRKQGRTLVDAAGGRKHVADYCMRNGHSRPGSPHPADGPGGPGESGGGSVPDNPGNPDNPEGHSGEGGEAGSGDPGDRPGAPGAVVPRDDGSESQVGRSGPERRTDDGNGRPEARRIPLVPGREAALLPPRLPSSARSSSVLPERPGREGR